MKGNGPFSGDRKRTAPARFLWKFLPKAINRGFCSRNLQGSGNESKPLSLKILLKTLVILVGFVFVYEVTHLLWLRGNEGWSVLSWMESVPDDGPSSQAKPEDVGQFEQVISYDGEPSNPWVDYLTLASLAVSLVSAWMLWARARPPWRIRLWRQAFFGGLAIFLTVSSLAFSGFFTKQDEITSGDWTFFANQLQVGDVIAYRKEKWSARRELFAEGKLTVIGYRFFKYGHLAIVVEDPGLPGRKVLFTSQGVKGVNLNEDIDSLRTHNWDAYRLDKWNRIDTDRIMQGVLSCEEEAGHFFGYDFTGMLALWNENLKPEQVSEFGTEYICSTSVVTLLYFGGFESDATPRQNLDLITPYQVVRAKGRFVTPPELPSPK